MTRLVGLVVLGFLIWLGLEVLLDRAKASLSGRARPGMPPRARPPVAAEALVRCASCGTYVPRSRARRLGAGEEEILFCSERCSRATATPPAESA